MLPIYISPKSVSEHPSSSCSPEMEVLRWKTKTHDSVYPEFHPFFFSLQHNLWYCDLWLRVVSILLHVQKSSSLPSFLLGQLLVSVSLIKRGSLVF